MSHDLRDPPRWLESEALSPDVRRELAEYGSAAPGGERRARMLSNLEQQLGTSLSAGAGSAGVGLTTKLKLLLGGVFLASSVALVALFFRAEAPRGASLSPPQAVGWVAPSPRFTVRAAEPVAEPIIEAPARAARPATQRPRASASLAPPAPPVGEEAREEQAAVPEPAVPEPVATTPSGASEAPASAGTLAELALLARARRSLLVRPERALELAAEHARLYPHGTFEEEREVLAIESLLKLARRDEAEARARAFERRFPNSSHRTHLIRLVSRE